MYISPNSLPNCETYEFIMARYALRNTYSIPKSKSTVKFRY